MIGIEVLGDKEFAAYLRTTATTAHAKLNPVINHYAEVLRMGILSFSSGRPGPEIDTGFYHESWTVEFSMNENGFLEAEVGSNAPYALRLEYGFVGMDSLGRNYNQPPFPHIGPAVDLVEPKFLEAMDGALVL